MVNFDCLSSNFEDRYEFMQCLQGIKAEYDDTKYVDVDDICRFLRLIKDRLFEFMEKLHQVDDVVGIKSILEDVFAIILTIHERTKEKHDLLEEFNNIHEILETYESHFGAKLKLNLLKDVMDQCKVYDSRSIDEVEKAKELRQQDRITRDDYSFLRE